MINIRVVEPPNWVVQTYGNSGNVYFELPDGFDLKFTKVVEQVTVLNKISREAILGFEIQATKLNTVLLEEWYYNTSQNFTGIEVEIIIEDKRIEFNRLFVSESADSNQGSFEVFITRNHWVDEMKSLKVVDAIKDISFIFNDQLVKDSWGWMKDWNRSTNPIYAFPVVDYGSFYNSSTITNEDVRPWISPLGLIDKIFCHIGYKFQTPLYDVMIGSSLWSYILKPNWYAYSGKGGNLKSRASVSSTYIIFGEQAFQTSNDSTGGNYDPGNNFNTSTHEFTYGGGTSGQVNLKVIGNGDYNQGNNITFYNMFTTIKVNGTEVETKKTSATYGTVNSFDWEEEFVVHVEPNDVVSVFTRFKRGYFQTILPVGWVEVDDNFQINSGTVDFGVSTNSIVSGDTVYLHEMVNEEMTCEDFIKGVAHLFNARFLTNRLDRNVYMYPFEDTAYIGQNIEGFYSDNNEIDFSDKVKPDSRKVLHPSNNTPRYYKFGFKNSSCEYISSLDLPEDPFRITYDIGFGNSQPVTRLNPIFEPTYERSVDLSAHGSNMRIICPAVYGNDYDSENISPTHEIGPRLMISWGNIQQSLNNASAFLNWKYNSETQTSFPCMTNGVATGYFHTVQQPKLVYGGGTENIFTAFYLKNILQSIKSPTHDYLVFVDMDEYWDFDERASYYINYNGESIKYRLVKLGDFSMSIKQYTPMQLIKSNC